MSAPGKHGGRVGRRARLGILVQVLFTLGLALAALLLVNWLVGRPGWRQRDPERPSPISIGQCRG